MFANAVLLHLTASQLDDVLAKTARAVGPGGLFAFTVKEGDGEEWSMAKLDAPRFFRYWRERPLRDRLEATGWQPTEVKHVQGRTEPWLFVICRRAAG